MTELVRLGQNRYVIANATGFRIHVAGVLETGILGEFLSETGTSDVTRQLLAGALYAGFQEARPLESKTEPGRIPLLAYLYLLAGFYLTTQATPPVMLAVGQRFSAEGRHAVAARCRQVAREESGHDRLVLLDLNSLGIPAEQFVSRLQPQPSLALVQRFVNYSCSDRPVACFGYAYALERTALFITEAQIAAVERVLPHGAKATRALRMHSSAGSDASHVPESIDFISALPADERATIVRAVYETAGLLSASQAGYPGDAAMRAILQDLGVAPVAAVG